MPLYDFACRECGRHSTLLMKYGDQAVCPDCRGTAMERKMAPCAFTGFATPGAVARPTAKAAPAHVHSGGCGCGPVAAREPCATEAKAAELVKKYLD